MTRNRAENLTGFPLGFFSNGFTLVELMVVVVIIGILVATAIPNLVSMRARAQEASTKSNMHTLQLVVEEFSTLTEGMLPGDLDTRCVDVNPNIGGDFVNKSIAAGSRLPPFPADALLGSHLKNPFLPVNNAVNNRLVPYPPVAIPPSGCVFYSSYQSDGVTPGVPGQQAHSYKITGFGSEVPLPITIP